MVKQLALFQNTLPADFIFTTANALGNNGDDVDSDADTRGKIPAFTVAAGQADNLTFDAGIYKKAPPVKPPLLSINDITVNEEDGTAELEICLDRVATEFVYVRYATMDNTALSGKDYVSQSSYAFIPAGEQCTKVIINILDDAIGEATELLKVILSAPFNAEIRDGEGMITILDTDKQVVTPSIVINDVVVNEEAGVAELKICLDRVSDKVVTVRYTTANGSAIAGTDYQTIDGVASIPAGQLCTTVTFPIIDDNKQEPTESFVVNLISPSNATILDNQGTVTILDKDKPVQPVLSINDITVNEEDGTAELEICLNQVATEFVYVRYATMDNTALSGKDYVSQSSYAFIPAGQRCTKVVINILDDAIGEATEVLKVVLSTPFNAEIGDGEGMITILDTDKQVVTPSIVINDVVVNEEAGVAELNICLNRVSDKVVTVRYTTANGSAIAGTDYRTTDGVASIPVGQLCTKVSFPIIDDNNQEPTESFVVNLVSPSNATILDNQGMVTILDKDVPVAPTLPYLSISDVTVNENEGFAHLQICLDRPATQTVTVDCITVNGTAVAVSDYFQTTDVATIPVGQTCTQASFKIVDDNIGEDTEVYYVNLSNPKNALIADGQGSITILDNDKKPDVSCPEMTITGGVGTITVTGLTAPIEIVQIFNSSWEIVFQCTNNCNPTEVVQNLPAGQYYVRINCYNNSWNLLCKEEGTVTVTEKVVPPTTGCQGNITNGGKIGTAETFCGAYDPSMITNNVAPSGGVTTAGIEYLWLSSTKGCPKELIDEIPGATGPTYDPGVIKETTYFVRCARRVGCNVWVESNCVAKNVYCEGNGGGTRPPTTGATKPCGDLTITYGNGEITMAGIVGESYYFKVNAIDQGWKVIHSCASSCGNTQTAAGLAAGRYLVTILDSKWREHCQTEIVLANSFNSEESARGRSSLGQVETKATKVIEKTLTKTQTAAKETSANTTIETLKSNQAATAAISIYPNPILSDLNINLGSLVGQRGHLYLRNQMGQVVKDMFIEEIASAPVKLQLEQLPSGVYFLTVFAEGAEGQLITTEKVVIQKR